MRTQIKVLAEELLIRNGYRGMSFGIIAAKLKMTRANIHYHFGNKSSLVEEIIEDYVRTTLEGLRGIWAAADLSFTEKIALMTEHSRRRYLKYNPPGKKGRPWSLIARMRQDSECLTPNGRISLQRFGKDLNSYITVAIETAKAKGEFVDTMPTEDVALQLVSIANSAAPITQDAGDFERLEQLYAGFTRIISVAFGTPETQKRSASSAVALTASRPLGSPASPSTRAS
ncbi:MAG: TetR/AcrR family transcriptional regulator [Parvibaculaceae bacterium]|jgi:AcrR family transcriptional regulator